MRRALHFLRHHRRQISVYGDVFAFSVGGYYCYWLFWLKKLNPNLANSDEFKVVRSLPLGSRERLMVIEIDNAQHLIGVTPHSINYLHKLETP